MTVEAILEGEDIFAKSKSVLEIDGNAFKVVQFRSTFKLPLEGLGKAPGQRSKSSHQGPPVWYRV